MSEPAKSELRVALNIAAVLAGGTFRFFLPKSGMHDTSANGSAAKAQEEAEIACQFPSHPWTPAPKSNPRPPLREANPPSQ